MPLWGKSKKKKAAKAAAAAEAKAKIEALAAKLQEDMASVMRSITDLDGETVMESENYGIAVANAMSGMTDAVTSFLPPAAEDDEAVYDEADDDGLASFAALREESQTEDLDGAPGLAFPGADDDAADADPPPPPPPTAGDGALNTPPAPDVRAHSGSRQAARPVRRLLLVDKQVSPHGHLANAALDTVTVIDYDSADTTLEELLGLIRGAHRKHDMPFTSIACAQHGPDEEGLWIWTSDHVIDLGGGSPQSPITQLVPIVEALGMALEKTRMGKAHIDFLACGLAGFAPRLVIGLEKMYGIDFRASTDDTGNGVDGGDWKMETDDDYDVAADYLDAARLKEYAETMGSVPSRQAKNNQDEKHPKKSKRERANQAPDKKQMWALERERLQREIDRHEQNMLAELETLAKVDDLTSVLQEYEIKLTVIEEDLKREGVGAGVRILHGYEAKLTDYEERLKRKGVGAEVRKAVFDAARRRLKKRKVAKRAKAVKSFLPTP